MASTTAPINTPNPKRREWIIRGVLAGPATLIMSVVALAAMPVWFPPGGGGINHIIGPSILFPAIWGAAFFYAILEKNLWRAAAVLLMITLINIVLAASSGGWT